MDGRCVRESEVLIEELRPYLSDAASPDKLGLVEAERVLRLVHVRERGHVSTFDSWAMHLFVIFASSLFSSSFLAKRSTVLETVL